MRPSQEHIQWLEIWSLSISKRIKSLARRFMCAV